MTNNRDARAIALLLILAIVVTLVALPATQAQAATMKTYAVIDAVPNPVGVGEEVLIRFGILQALGTVAEGWTGITVTVVKPDGTTETLGPFRTDSTGGSATLFTPAAVGTYKLRTNFPQQIAPSTFFDLERGTMIFEGTVMKASTSETLNLVVQQTPLPPYPGIPLPTEFWSRPVDPQLREWASIAGNWMSRPDNSLALYNDDAPETAHVLWTKPLDYYGGLTGGLLGTGQVPASHETGDAYEGKWQNSVIINGILYYNRMPAGFAGSYQPQNGIFAVDLHTGEQLWFRNNTWLSFGQILYFNSFNYDGVYSYLWDTSVPGRRNAYSPSTGEWLYSFTNVPSGTQVFGPNGEILIYQINYTARWMALWNSTAAGQAHLTAPGDFGSWGRLVHGQTWNASDPKAYSWNVTIPAGLSASMSFFTPILKVYPDRVMSIDLNQTRVRVWALNTKDLTKTSTSASKIFDKEWKAPAEWLEGLNTLHYVGATDEAENGVIAVWSKELRKHYGFSTDDGRYLWETDSEHWLDAYGWGNVEHTWYFAYGKLYSVGIAGIVYAYDLKTGKTSWIYNMTDAYNEPVTGNNWWGWISLIADNKIYVGTLEHSAEMPLPRGGPFICLNATNGDEIWRVNGMFRATRWGGNAVMGDSIIATMDTYDQRIYAIGKGPSATTVTVAPEVSVHGNSVLIKGTVTDISAATKENALTARFPNGVPAVSDESMSDWMLYVYKQFARPANAKGVEVTIDAIDPNNNWIHIGTATSDTSGTFGYAWTTPPVPGKYTIIATFAGSGAYYASYAETYAIVSEAPPATPPPTYPMPIDTTLTIISTGIAIIIAVAIATVLILRKRP